MKPLICYSIRFLDEFDSYGDFEGYEIRNLAGYFNIIKIMKLKDKLKGNDLKKKIKLWRRQGYYGTAKLEAELKRLQRERY